MTKREETVLLEKVEKHRKRVTASKKEGQSLSIPALVYFVFFAMFHLFSMLGN